VKLLSVQSRSRGGRKRTPPHEKGALFRPQTADAFYCIVPESDAPPEPDVLPDVDEPAPRVSVEPEVVEPEPERLEGLPYSELLPDGVDVRPPPSLEELQPASASAPTMHGTASNFLFMVPPPEFQLFRIATLEYRAAARRVTRAKTRREQKKFRPGGVTRTLILSNYAPRGK